MPIIPPFPHLSAHPAPVIKPLPKDGKFTLDPSGLAGFFGGDGAVSGMATVNLYRYRWLGGWYNTPGSYEIAKQFGQLANSRLFNGLFPGGTSDPAQLFGLDGKSGPKFVATHSGSLFARTGHFAYLISRMARDIIQVSTPMEDDDRKTVPSTVTVIALSTSPEEVVKPNLRQSRAGFRAVGPILCSIVACVVCALAADWWSFGNILIGMLASGFACFVLGSGRLTAIQPTSTIPEHVADGILMEVQDIVVLLGYGSAVNAVTRGRFYLQYPPWNKLWKEWWRTVRDRLRLQYVSVGKRLHAWWESARSLVPLHDTSNSEERAPLQSNDSSSSMAFFEPMKTEADRTEVTDGDPPRILIGLTSVFLATQFLFQLLTISQGTLTGQIMFVTTLVVSWMYNVYLSSLNSEDIQTEILLGMLYPESGVARRIMRPKEQKEKFVQKFQFKTWTGMAVFTLYALDPPNPRSTLDKLIPNDTLVWDAWKKVVVNGVRRRKPPQFNLERLRNHLGIDNSSTEAKLLSNIVSDANGAYLVWNKAKTTLPSVGPPAAEKEADTSSPDFEIGQKDLERIKGTSQP